MRTLFALASLSTCLAAPIFSQPVVSMPYAGGTVNSQGVPAISFALQADPPSAMLRCHSGSSNRFSLGPGGGESFAHRYLYNEDDQTYFGYDVRVELDPQNPGGPWHVTFSDLSIGPIDAIPFLQRGNPAAWKKISIALPAPQTMKSGDSIRIELWADPAAGQKLADLVRISQAPSMFSSTVNQQLAAFNSRVGAAGRSPARSIPTVSGDARGFSAEDGEMHLAQVSLTVNGELQPPGRTTASGTLVWFYLPDHGRYILSLAPRPELGFVKAGEVRGGAVTFTVGNDKFLIESPVAITTGNSAYFLYVLHDTAWEPTAKNQGDRVQFGSVNPRELVLLQKK
jgi:hypothetical protein